MAVRIRFHHRENFDAGTDFVLDLPEILAQGIVIDEAGGGASRWEIRHLS